MPPCRRSPVGKPKRRAPADCGGTSLAVNREARHCLTLYQKRDTAVFLVLVRLLRSIRMALTSRAGDRFGCCDDLPPRGQANDPGGDVLVPGSSGAATR
jgi:hypothetical protein